MNTKSLIVYKFDLTQLNGVHVQVAIEKAK